MSGLHLLLAQAPCLTSVQCPGTSLLTDKDLMAILDTGALARLTKLGVRGGCRVQNIVSRTRS